jgi:spermidine synthase
MVREKALSKIIFIGFGLSGMAALTYEVVWTRSLSTVMGSSTYALSTMLAAFMAGLSLGGWLGARFSPRIRNMAVAFALCELGIGLVGFITIPLIKALTPVYVASFHLFHLSFNTFSLVQFVIIFLIMGIPTTLMGLTFPLVVRLFTRGGEDAGKQSGNLYCINTFGAIVGAISAGFLLIPLIGARGTAMAAAAVNIFTALLILILSGEFRKTVSAAAALLIATSGSAVLHGQALPYLVFNYFSANRLGDYAQTVRTLETIEMTGDGTVLYANEGVNGDVRLIRYRDSDNTYSLALINNGKLEGGDEKGFALLADLPVLTHTVEEKPVDVLSIGLGSGHTLANIARYPVDHIDSVELSKGILEANRLYLNPALFHDPRIEHIEADGRNFLTVSRREYDAIVVSPSWAVEMASGSLLTDEFLHLASSRLHKTGAFALWIDYFLMEDEDFFTLLRTFARNFRSTTAWYVDGDVMILVGTNSERTTPVGEITDIVNRTRPELAGLFSVAFTMEEIRGISRGLVNTDDRPVIEFRNARNIITGVKPRGGIGLSFWSGRLGC